MVTHTAQIIAYDKKKLVSDSRLGEARAPLNQLPRGRTARLNLVDHKTFGNIAGHVDFTLSGGGAGGEGAGNDSAWLKSFPCEMSSSVARCRCCKRCCELGFLHFGSRADVRMVRVPAAAMKPAVACIAGVLCMAARGVLLRCSISLFGMMRSISTHH